MNYRYLLPAALLRYCAALLLGCSVAALAADELTGVARSTLEIHAKTGMQRLAIYLAVTPEQQERGLMFVRELPADTGMLFPLGSPRPMSMWMKNTLISLDMLFIDQGGRVVCLRERAVPKSEAIISCDRPVKAVLEIGGGQAAKRGLAVGDLVVHPSISK
jgi:uncharacterized membrane protein (UPF0127 family)